MILVDTSIWVNHFRKQDASLVQTLLDGQAAIHPFILGELACGTMRNRTQTLLDLRNLRQAPFATEAEVHHLLDAHRLAGSGLGWVDLHLLTSALLAGWSLSTADAAMQRTAARLGIAP